MSGDTICYCGGIWQNSFDRITSLESVLIPLELAFSVSNLFQRGWQWSESDPKVEEKRSGNNSANSLQPSRGHRHQLYHVVRRQWRLNAWHLIRYNNHAYLWRRAGNPSFCPSTISIHVCAFIHLSVCSSWLYCFLCLFFLSFFFNFCLYKFFLSSLSLFSYFLLLRSLRTFLFTSSIQSYYFFLCFFLSFFLSYFCQFVCVDANARRRKLLFLHLASIWSISTQNIDIYNNFVIGVCGYIRSPHLADVLFLSLSSVFPSV